MNQRSRMASRLIVVVLLTTFSGVVVADIYVSRDASGKLIYSDREPDGPHKRIRVEARSVSPTPADATAASQSESYERAAQDREERASRAEQERIAAVEERARRCDQARRQSAIYGVDGRKCDYDAEGNRKCLSSAEIDAKRAEAKQLMAENCNSPAGA